MEFPIICTTSAEIEEKIKDFQSVIANEGRRELREYAVNGGKTITAQTYLRNATVAAYNGITSGPRPQLIDIMIRAVKLMRVIIEMHVFLDGNGRSGMYALNLFLASWGYKLSLSPLALHAYLMGEKSNQIELPLDAATSLTPFTKPLVTEGEGRSHVTHIFKRMKSLEARRNTAISLGRTSLKDYAVTLVTAGNAALTKVVPLQKYEEDRRNKNQKIKDRLKKIAELKFDLKVHICTLQNNPWADRAMDELFKMLNNKIECFEKVNDRLPTFEEIKSCVA